MSRREHLRELIQHLVPQDATEATHRQRVLALLEQATDPFDRAHYTPGHITASAFVLDPSRQQLLLILHQKLERWLQPGGHVDPGDADVIAAARREIAEETGLTQLQLSASSLLDVDVHRIPPRPGAPAHEHFDVRFAFVAADTGASAGSDAQAVRWLPLRALLARANAPESGAASALDRSSSAGGISPLVTDESVLRAVRKLAARHT